MDAEEGEERQEDYRRSDHLHHADPQIAKAAVDPQRAALFGFGKKETDISHTGSKIRPGKTTQQRNNNKYPKWSSNILDRHAQPNTRHNQDHCT